VSKTSNTNGAADLHIYARLWRNNHCRPAGSDCCRAGDKDGRNHGSRYRY